MGAILSAGERLAQPAGGLGQMVGHHVPRVAGRAAVRPDPGEADAPPLGVVGQLLPEIVMGNRPPVTERAPASTDQ
jgi:hypothetical protein